MEIPINKVERYLDDLEQCCVKFEEVLSKEFTALKSPSPNELVETISTKQETIDEIFQIEASFRELFNLNEYKPLRNILQDFCESLSPAQERIRLEIKLDHIVQLLEICKEKNQVNGMIISNNLELKQRILHAIIKPAKNADVYNEKGKVG